MWSYIKAGAGDILLAVQQEILDVTTVFLGLMTFT